MELGTLSSQTGETNIPSITIDLSSLGFARTMTVRHQDRLLLTRPAAGSDMFFMKTSPMIVFASMPITGGSVARRIVGPKTGRQGANTRADKINFFVSRATSISGLKAASTNEDVIYPP